MNAPPSSRHCTAASTPVIPQIALEYDREGKRTALSAVSTASRNAIAARRQLSSPTPEL